MECPKHHIFVCASYRVSGEPQGLCHKKGSVSLLQYIEEEILDRGMGDVLLSSTGCLKQCERGPILVVYPENHWYGGIDSEEAIDAVLDAIEEGTVADAYLLTAVEA
ncbi:(2Fe-2S) ferredoxin domain-containing protein [Desulfoluna spongiiphila]|uniref:(2Fe-2S) ferredoxin n=1 Tax=Desulfoluna spongiiphila TaxID=419481 RepID=A0A1G5HSR6_9BACT|nr:(2Fe-2S) ferredoxin domain-containing protein [Desulfoluna spongiiphila]SCY66922.1 (2Fe-2S) ferredoxin [Desulfoluna spongiiphila]VVS91842.1 thioredoxin-like superfamily [Desulfoluna spongiiphila]